ncbi:MAG: NUDIX hydrolase [Opitutales bacterium]|nr:NUDIX hydrolase [Opitutales bacterium]
MDFKISVLIFVRDIQGRLLLIERKKEPNKGAWSPIGGKLEMQSGESPFQCAIREAKEEIGIGLKEGDLHLFSIISEKAYEGSTNWLMFLFDCKKRISKLPETIDEGRFKFFAREEIDQIKIPETDRTFIWHFWDNHRQNFTALRADCDPQKKLAAVIEEQI